MFAYGPSPLFTLLGLAFIARGTMAQQAAYGPSIVSCIQPRTVSQISPAAYQVSPSALVGGTGPSACAAACTAAGYTYSLLLDVASPPPTPDCRCTNTPFAADFIQNGDPRTGACYATGYGPIYTVFDARTTFQLDYCSPVYPGSNVPIVPYTDGPNWPEPVPIKQTNTPGPHDCFTFCVDQAYTSMQPSFQGGYTCWCYNDISVINSPDELDDCSPYNAYYYTNSAVATMSAALRRRARLSDRLKATKRDTPSALCPQGLSACNVEGTHMFECIDTSSELESCGGCLHGHFGNTTSTGSNCATIPGVKMGGATCTKGRCEISACKSGFTLVDGACVEARLKGRVGRV